MNQYPTNPLSLLVRHLRVHVDMSAEDEKAILELRHKVRPLEAHSFVLREGDKPEVCAI